MGSEQGVEMTTYMYTRLLMAETVKSQCLARQMRGNHLPQHRPLLKQQMLQTGGCVHGCLSSSQSDGLSISVCA